MKDRRYISESVELQELGSRLAAQRLTLNLTQAQLAEQAGVSKRTLERLESGAVSTQLSAFLRVCRVLGLHDRLELLVPEPESSPIAQLKLKGRTRKRASGSAETAGVHESKSKRWVWEP